MKKIRTWLCVPWEKLRKDLGRPLVSISGWSSAKGLYKTIKIKNNKKNKQALGKGEIWFPELPHYYIQESTKINHKACKGTAKYGSFREKKKSIDAVPKKDIMANTLDKDFKGNVLKMPNRLKEDMEKAEKTKCEWKEISMKWQNQREVLDGAQKYIAAMKNSLEGFKSRFQ